MRSMPICRKYSTAAAEAMIPRNFEFPFKPFRALMQLIRIVGGIAYTTAAHDHRFEIIFSACGSYFSDQIAFDAENTYTTRAAHLVEENVGNPHQVTHIHSLVGHSLGPIKEHAGAVAVSDGDDLLSRQGNPGHIGGISHAHQADPAHLKAALISLKIKNIFPAGCSMNDFD